MDLVIIFGPQAVGKMTVGEELAKSTGLKLFHNHMTIDLVLKLFSYEEGQDLIWKFRDEIFKKMASSKSSKGMIFTYVWAFNMEDDWNYMKYIRDIFMDHNVYYAELNTSLETRLERNITENRLNKKWTKLDTEWTTNEIKRSNDKYRLMSYEGEITYENYIRIDNTNLSPEEVSEIIINRFKL